MEWDAKQYDQEHDFVFKYGNALLNYLPKHPSMILDVGCGTGALTTQIAEMGHYVDGIDQSQNMIDAAQAEFPNGHFIHGDILRHQFNANTYDVVFSNAVFHWINDQERLTSIIKTVLKPGGQLICEFGGVNNIKLISDAFGHVTSQLGYDYHMPFYFPRVETYGALLKAHGFNVIKADDYDRPTPLKGGKQGLRNWVQQFFASDIVKIDQPELVYSQMEAQLAPQLWQHDHWEADYRRIRVIAEKVE